MVQPVNLIDTFFVSTGINMKFSAVVCFHSKRVSSKTNHEHCSTLSHVWDVQYHCIPVKPVLYRHAPCRQTGTLHFRHHSRPAGSPHRCLSSCLSPGRHQSHTDQLCHLPPPGSPSSTGGEDNSTYTVCNGTPKWNKKPLMIGITGAENASHY